MLVRNLRKMRLKLDCVDEYLKAHEAVWPELLAEYEEGGFKQISCFLDGLDLYVFTEYDDEQTTANAVEPKWQAYMDTLKELKVAPYDITEVYRADF